jgi:predicted ester cyclase
MAEELKTIVHRLIENAFNKGNLDMLDELCATDLVRHRPPYPDVEGLEDYRQWIARFLQALPDAQFTVDEIVVEGNTVVARLTYRGTNTGRLGSIPPTGNEVTGPVCIVYHFVEGKVAEEWD